MAGPLQGGDESECRGVIQPLPTTLQACDRKPKPRSSLSLMPPPICVGRYAILLLAGVSWTLH